LALEVFFLGTAIGTWVFLLELNAVRGACRGRGREATKAV
jgi:hypothetical protein